LKDELDGAWAVRPLKLVREGGGMLLVLEAPGGEPLERLLGTPMAVGSAVRLTVDIAAALGKLHQRGFVHKDVKPAHILVNCTDGRPRLTGFGIASQLRRERAAPEPPETLAGTLAYMAPATGTPADLLRRRPDLIVAERRLAASNARIGAAIAEYYPKVSLSGLLGSATTVASGNLFSAGANQAAGVAGLRWRLFDFGRIGAQIDQAKGQEAEALAGYRLAVLHASEDVENAFTALVKREEQTNTLQRGELALRQARNSSFAAYEKGVVRLIEVLLADENLLKTSDAKAQAEAQSSRAAIAAFKALGGGWQAAAAAPGDTAL